MIKFNSRQFKNPTERNNASFGFWFAITLLFIFIDQASKWYASNNVPAIFLNDRFAFSIPLPVFLMYGLYLAVFLFVGNYLYKARQSLTSFEKYGWCLILAGGLSNLGERLVLGHVRDFIPILNGILNFADFFIIFGLVMVLLSQRHQK